MALTLIEAAKAAQGRGEVVRSAIIELFARASEILRVMPFENIAGNALRYSREETLPGIAFRGVNESYTESTGALNPLVEALFIAGGDLDVDRFLVNTMGDSIRSTHEGMKVKALASEWTRVFVKGDSTTNPREFDGLQKRLVGSQLIAAGSTSGGDALSLAKLDEAIDAVDNPTHIFMSKRMRSRLTQAARDTTVGGFITYDKDEFGRRITRYGDLPILVPYEQNKNTSPLAFDEANPGGGSNVGTSLYVVSIGPAALTGIQNGDMMVDDLGMLDSAPVFRTRVEWYCGMALYSGYAASRLYGVKDAAITK